MQSNLIAGHQMLTVLYANTVNNLIAWEWVFRTFLFCWIILERTVGTVYNLKKTLVMRPALFVLVSDINSTEPGNLTHTINTHLQEGSTASSLHTPIRNSKWMRDNNNNPGTENMLVSQSVATFACHWITLICKSSAHSQHTPAQCGLETGVMGRVSTHKPLYRTQQKSRHLGLPLLALGCGRTHRHSYTDNPEAI